MIKKIIKILSLLIAILIVVIIYLSIIGIKTDKFNKQISENILRIDENIKISFNEISYLLNLYDFSINIKTKKPKILLKDGSLEINYVQTNVSLKSLFNKQFSIDDLQIEIKEIKIKDIIKLAELLKNTRELYILDTIIKKGLVNANINLNFDENGKIKKDYIIEGSIKKANLNIFNKLELKNFNFNFDINKDFYSLKKIDLQINNTNFTSPSINIDKKKNFFFVEGQILNRKKNFDIDDFKLIFSNSLNNIDLQKFEFSSKNNFSFIINKNFKFEDFKVESIIDLNELIINEKKIKLKEYFPSFTEEIKLEQHKIIINYYKNKFEIKGEGNILLEDKLDTLTYKVTKKKNNFFF